MNSENKLSEQDFNQLASILGTVNRSLAYMHGLASAMCAMSNLPALEEWQELIALTSEEGWKFENEKEEDKAMALLTVFINEVKQEMEAGDFSLPFFSEEEVLSDEEKTQVISLAGDWARGYLEGASLDDEWATIISEDEEIMMLISPSMYLSGIMDLLDEEEELNALEDDGDIEDDIEDEDLESDEIPDDFLEDIEVQFDMVKTLPVMNAAFYKNLSELKKETPVN